MPNAYRLYDRLKSTIKKILVIDLQRSKTSNIYTEEKVVVNNERIPFPRNVIKVGRPTVVVFFADDSPLFIEYIVNVNGFFWDNIIVLKIGRQIGCPHNN